MSKCVTSQHVSVFKQHSKKGLKQFLLLCLVSLCLLALTACGTTASGVQPPGPAEPDLPGEQDIPATPNPETFTDLSLVLHDEVSWAAIQQGDEAWRVVRKPGELSSESMPRVKGEFGFAYVCQHERRADVYLQMADTRDIAERERIVRCSSGVQDEVEEEIYHLGGLVSGVDVGEGGYIFAGSRTPAEFFHRAESQKLEYDFPRLFSEGKYDLIALKGRGNLSEFLPGKAIIKRDEAIIKDSIVDFDFDTEAVDLTKHKISLTNLAFEEEETPYLGLLFSTKNLQGTSAYMDIYMPAFEGISPMSATFDYAGFPESVLKEDDFHMLIATGMSEACIRTKRLIIHEAKNLAMSLPDCSRVQMSETTHDAVLLPLLKVDDAPQQNSVRLSFHQKRLNVSVNLVNALEEGQFQYPDLSSLEGWQAAWSLQSYSPYIWHTQVSSGKMSNGKYLTAGDEFESISKTNRLMVFAK